MTDNENHSNNGFWLGVIVGGLLGAVVAYIFGSEDKEELKKKLREKGKILLKNLEDFKEKVGESSEGLREKMVSEVGEVEQKVGELPETVQDAVQTVKKSAKNFFLKKGKPLAKR